MTDEEQLKAKKEFSDLIDKWRRQYPVVPKFYVTKIPEIVKGTSIEKDFILIPPPSVNDPH